MKKYFFPLLCIALFIGALSLSQPVFADSFGTDATAKAAGLSQKYNRSVPDLIGTLIGAALSMIGVIFFILMVYGGFLWMTARGEDSVVNKAKETIIAAIIGLIVVLGSYAITNFIFTSAEPPQAGQPNT